MKIHFLLTQDLESPSGLGRYFPLARELVNLGHQVTVSALHSDFSSLKETQFQRDGVQVNYVAQMHVTKRGNTKQYFGPLQLLWVTFLATWKLSLAALRVPADIIHICKPHPMNAIAGLLGKWLKKKVVFLDYDDFETGSGRFSGQWERWIVSFFERRVPFKVDRITTHSVFLKGHLVSLGVPSRKIFYLPNGVDLTRFKNLEPNKISELRQGLGITGKKVIVYIGSLALTNHPVDILIRALPLVQEKIPEAILLLVGGGEDFETIAQAVKQRGVTRSIVMTGRISPELVGYYYSLGDVSADPVDDDATAKGRSPLKLFESWACGIPFVTGDVGERRDLLSNPPAGILVKPGDETALANGIIELLSQPVLSENLRQAGYIKARGYSWDILVKSIEADYQSYLSVPDRTQVT